MASNRTDVKREVHFTAHNGDLETLKQCILHGADVDCEDFFGKSPLHYAAWEGHLPVVLYLQGENANIEVEDWERRTPLHYAAQRGHLSIMQFLLRKNANIEATDMYGRTALMLASRLGNVELVECLLNHGANVEVSDISRHTPLQLASAMGSVDLLECLLNHGANIEVNDYHGRTPLHVASANHKIDAVEYLLSHKANIEATDIQRKTPLHVATEHGDVTVMQCLLDNQASPDVRDIQGGSLCGNKHWHYSRLSKYPGPAFPSLHVPFCFVFNELKLEKNTPLHKATENGDLSAVECLLRHQAKTEIKNNQKHTPLYIAMANDHIDIVRRLLYNGADCRTIDDIKRTPLHIAAVYGDLELVKWLIEHNADVNAEDKGGNIPLLMASRQNQLPVLQYLISYVSNIDIVNKIGNTALHLCLNNVEAKLDVVKLLLSNGSDINIRNIKKQSPFDIVVARGHRDVIRIFKHIMAIGLPKEMRYLNVEDADSFKRTLQSGFYFSYLGKIMMVGTECVGKSAIVSIIMGKRPPKTRQSTEGIDVHVCRAAVDMETNKLIPKGLRIEDVAYRNLMMRERCLLPDEKLRIRNILSDDDLLEDIDTISSDDCTDSVTADLYIQNEEESSNTKDKMYNEEAIRSSITSKTKKLFRRTSSAGSITSEMLKKGTIRAGKKGLFKMNLAPVIILDFAGQRVFNSTHQSFLTHRGVYILTINGSRPLHEEMATESVIPGRHDKPTTKGYIIFWVSSILTYSKGRSKVFPKILVCCTHKDKVPLDKVEEQRTYIYSEIKRIFDNTPAMPHLVLQHRLFINALDPHDPEIETLKDAIVEIMYQQPSWGEKIPKAWIHLEMMINKNVKNGVKVMHLNTLQELNRENPLQSLNNKELDVFLKIHHAQGNIIHFHLPGLQDHIIISPPYLVDALSSIVTHKQFCIGQRLRVLKLMNQDGILRKQDIDTIWKRNKELLKHKDYLIALMCHLDILAEPRIYHPDSDHLLHSDFFFVPSLVTQTDSTSFLKQDNLNLRSLGISFKFHSSVLPPAIGFRFISCCVEMWEVVTYENQKMLFSGMTVVCINKSLMLVVQMKEQRVDIFLIHETSRFQIIPDMAASIRECLNDTLYRISNSYKLSSAGLDVDTESVLFHLEYTCSHVESPCYHGEQTDWVCERHGESLSLESFKLWFVDRKEEACANDCRGISKDALQERPSELQLAKLVSQVSWDDLRPVLVHLGMKIHEIRVTEIDYSGNILNVMFLCLRKWRVKNGNGALLDVYKAIEEEGGNLHVLCKVFRDKPLSLPYEMLEKEPTDKDLDLLATHVIEESLLFAVQLSIDASFWIQMKDDGHKIVNINRKILGAWRDGHPGKPKIRELAQALSNIGISIDVLLSVGH